MRCDVAWAVKEQHIVLQGEDREAGSAAAGKKERYGKSQAPLFFRGHDRLRAKSGLNYIVSIKAVQRRGKRKFFATRGFACPKGTRGRIRGAGPGPAGCVASGAGPSGSPVG